MPVLNTFKADLFYGASGTTKTSNIGRAAEYILKKYGLLTRLASADGGGWETIDPLVEAGIVVPWPIRMRDKLVECIDKACQGYWPEDPNNPRSPLHPPTIVLYKAECYRCKAARPEDPSKWTLWKPQPAMPPNIVCPTCKAVVGPRPIDIHVTAEHQYNPLNDMRRIGLVAFEGLTSFGDAILEYLMATKASLSQDPSFTWVDGDTGYSGGNMTYYGFVQNRLYEFVHKSHMIPFAKKVIWTALEGKGEEEATKVPIFGPAIAGKKATGKAPQWFGNTLHFESIQSLSSEKDANQQTKMTSQPVIYLRNHPEMVSKVPFQAKTRAPYGLWRELPDFWEANVATLYEKLDELKARAMANLPKIPGDGAAAPAAAVKS